MLKQTVKKVMLTAIIAAMTITAASCCSAPSAGIENTSSVSEPSAAIEPEVVKTAVGESTTEKATEKATEKVTEKATEKATEKPTEKVKTEEEKAIEEKGLKVDSKGNVVDKNGNKVKVDANGNVEVKTSDGQTIKITTQEIKNTTSSNSNSNTSNKNTSSNNNNNSSSKPSTNNNNNNSSSKPSTNNNNNNSSSSTPNTNNNNNNSSSSTPSTPVEKPTTPKATEPQKTWHDAVYEYVEHPAETKKVWVVDKAAYTYEEPVYERHGRTICNWCGEDITDNLIGHLKANPEHGNYHDEWREVQVGVKTVTVPEEGHYETKIVKEAWTEKVLVKEAGYY